MSAPSRAGVRWVVRPTGNRSIITTLSIGQDPLFGLPIGPLRSAGPKNVGLRYPWPDRRKPLHAGRSRRDRGRRGEPLHMLRPVLGLSEPDLERELLRKGVGALEAGRASCHDCG